MKLSLAFAAILLAGLALAPAAQADWCGSGWRRSYECGPTRGRGDWDGPSYRWHPRRVYAPPPVVYVQPGYIAPRAPAPRVYQAPPSGLNTPLR